MKKEAPMKRKIASIAAATAALVVLAGCSTPSEAQNQDDAEGQYNNLWLMGGDNPDTLRDYLKTEYKKATGGTLTIEEQGWGDALAKRQTALPYADNAPDATEIGNTWSPT